MKIILKKTKLFGFMLTVALTMTLTLLPGNTLTAKAADTTSWPTTMHTGCSHSQCMHFYSSGEHYMKSIQSSGIWCDIWCAEGRLFSPATPEFIDCCLTRGEDMPIQYFYNSECPAEGWYYQDTVTGKYYPCVVNQITYHLNDGEWEDNYTAPECYTEGSEVVLPSSDHVVRDGYTFLGWTATEGEEDKNYITTVSTTETGAKTYYAKWKKNITELPESQYSTIGSTFTSKWNYEDFSTVAGSVRNITGAADATAEKNLNHAKIVNATALPELLKVTADEQSQGVNVWLKATEASNIGKTEKETITAAAGNYTVGQYLDVALYEKIGSATAKQVSETNGTVTISMIMPENLRAVGRTYKVVRLHNGATTVLDATCDETTWMLTFESNQFSTYAIIYTDAAQTAIPAATTSNTVTSPKTGVSFDLCYWIIAMMGICMAGVTLVHRKQFFRNEGKDHRN